LNNSTFRRNNVTLVLIFVSDSTFFEKTRFYTDFEEKAVDVSALQQ